MPDEYKIADVLAGEISPGVEGWLVVTVRPGDVRYQHAIPQVAFEWRAAEYGLTDPAEILDVILHEPYQETAAPALPQSVKAPPVKAVVAAKAQDRHGPTLQQATSTRDAREAHRSRIAAVKTDRVRVTDPDGLLPHVYSNHRMDPDRVRAKREAVDVNRWNRLYGGLPVPVTTYLEAPRA
ncbi:hypothetical protein [Streptomyces canus]|uniref:hypothetical protein n=1 Tax=Streptomyces canus TaxID=58343 RepID=UPI002785C361|nr:hypothetical protein [Streptomyces canus]MDQ0758688.1 hypothetical protein [Streptomyces canus]